MSMQDDIFDIEAVLKKHKPELEMFHSILKCLYMLEEQNSQLLIDKRALIQTIKILKESD